MKLAEMRHLSDRQRIDLALANVRRQGRKPTRIVKNPGFFREWLYMGSHKYDGVVVGVRWKPHKTAFVIESEPAPPMTDQQECARREYYQAYLDCQPNSVEVAMRLGGAFALLEQSMRTPTRLLYPQSTGGFGPG